MTKAIRIHETGGPEVLTWEDVEVGDPGEGEVRIRHTAVGLNFIDIYQRSGLYPLPDLPLTLGTEGAGVVEAVGPGVEGIEAGQRVAYAGGQLGSYAEARVMPAGVLVPVPDAVDDRTAAAMMLKGMTAHMLLFKAYAVRGGRSRAGPCGGRRRRLHPGPVGEAPGRDGHRHRGLGGQGRAGQGPRRRSRDQLQRRGFRRTGGGDHRRPGRPRGLRLGGQGHLREVPGLPRPNGASWSISAMRRARPRTSRRSP